MFVAVRIVVSAVLLTLILTRVDWHGVRSAMDQADWLWFSFALAAFNCSMVCAAKRWQLIVCASGVSRARLKTTTAIAATYVSQWFSNFLPTAFGGDIARVVVARRSGASLPIALASAVLDRYIGLTTLALIFVLLELSLAAAGTSRPLLPIAGALAVCFGGLLILIWGGSHVALPRRWLRLRVARFAARATGLLRELGATPSVSGRVLIASLAATLLGAAAYWGAVRCVSTSVGFPVALAAAVLGTLASIIPISLSGWGVREGTVAAVLVGAGGMSASDASLTALLNAAVIALTSLIGLAVSLSVRWSWRSAGDTVRLRSGLSRSDLV